MTVAGVLRSSKKW